MLSEVREKSESFEGFSAVEIFFSKHMLGSPNWPIRHFLKIFRLRLLAEMLDK